MGSRTQMHLFAFGLGTDGALKTLGRSSKTHPPLGARKNARRMSETAGLSAAALSKHVTALTQMTQKPTLAQVDVYCSIRGLDVRQVANAIWPQFGTTGDYFSSDKIPSRTSVEKARQACDAVRGGRTQQNNDVKGLKLRSKSVVNLQNLQNLRADNKASAELSGIAESGGESSSAWCSYDEMVEQDAPTGNIGLGSSFPSPRKRHSTMRRSESLPQRLGSLPELFPQQQDGERASRRSCEAHSVHGVDGEVLPKRKARKQRMSRMKSVDVLPKQKERKSVYFHGGHAPMWNAASTRA